ncbi:MAG: PAS domain S-box protein [Nitrospinae bacterium]|nr:PAS domain S-box protein [Nitrospinota bacterium]
MGIQDERLSKAVNGIARHEHAGLIYKSPSEKYSVLIPFIKTGLERGERCVYLCGSAHSSPVLEALSAGGVDVHGAVDTGALVIEDQADWLRGNGDAADFLESAFEDSVDGGYTALRVAGEVACEGLPDPPPGNLAEHREGLNRFFSGKRATGLFLYDAQKAGSGVILQAINAHPLIMYGGVLCKNFYFSPRSEKESEEHIRIERILESLKERELAEQALKESEEKYRQLMNEAGDAILLADAEGNLLDSNRKAQELFGYTREELGRMHFQNLHPEHELPKAVAGFHQVMQGSGRFPEILVRAKNGRVFPVEIAGNLIEVGGRKVLQGIFRDITLHKQMERALRESEDLYRQMFDRSPAVNLLIDTITGEIVDANSTAAAYYGYTKEDLRRMKIAYLVAQPPDEAGEQMRRASAEEETRFNALHRLASGEVRDVEVSAGPVEVGGRTLLHAMVYDVTRRKQAEAGLKESEERYRTLVEVLPDAVVVHTGGRIVYANPAAVELMRFSSTNDILGRAVLDFVHPDFRDAVIKRISVPPGTGPLPMIEEKFVRGDGSVIDVEVAAMPIMYEGKPSRLAVFRNVTERKQAQQALKESEERFRLFFETSFEGVLIHDKGIIVDANRAFTAITGYSHEECIGKSAFDMVAPEWRDTVARHIAEGYERAYEIYGLRKDGTRLQVEVQGRNVPYKGKTMRVTSLRDISGRSAAETELRRSKDGLDAAQRIARLGNWDWDIVNNTLAWSDEIYRIFGLAPREFGATYEAFLETVHPDDRQAVANGVTGALEGETHYNIDHRIVLRDGSIKFVHEQAEVYRGTGGAPVRMVGTVQDVTERKAAEEELIRAKEEAEQATQIKDKFVSLVSHDLKGPLSAMLGFLRLVYDEHAAKMEMESRGMFDTALDTGHKMVELIDELLNISKLKTGKLTLELRFVDARELAEKVISSLTPLAERKGVQIKNSLPPKSRIHADEVLFSQVLHNLVSNAIKFTGDGGLIEVFIPRGQRSTVAVADSGVGISPKNLETLFNYEVKTSTRGTAGEMGTGLGLPLCYDIMRAHGGVLKADSDLGKGSVFYAVLPYMRPRVLVADDDELTLKLIAEILGDFDCDLIPAHDGREALELASSRQPHVVVTDIYMPEMDGYELLRALRANKSLRAVPVIAMTGKGGKERETMLQQGADDFIAKPSLAFELVPRLGKYIL